MTNAIQIYLYENVVTDKKKGVNIENIRHMKIPLKKIVFMKPNRFAGIMIKELPKLNPTIAIRPKIMP
ncbi:MAG: hypothetical protein K0B07_02240 [DPANN group archaeon]|nr:hypothetical protein [DPANN group archaeon]